MVDLEWPVKMNITNLYFLHIRSVNTRKRHGNRKVGQTTWTPKSLLNMNECLRAPSLEGTLPPITTLVAIPILVTLI